MTETIAPELCETCLERGRNRPGTHEVGAGWMCDACFKGKATRPEENQGETHGQHDERRLDLWKERNADTIKAQRRRRYLRQRNSTRPSGHGAGIDAAY